MLNTEPLLNAVEHKGSVEVPVNVRIFTLFIMTWNIGDAILGIIFPALSKILNYKL